MYMYIDVHKIVQVLVSPNIDCHVSCTNNLYLFNHTIRCIIHVCIDTLHMCTGILSLYGEHNITSNKKDFVEIIKM